MTSWQESYIVMNLRMTWSGIQERLLSWGIKNSYRTYAKLEFNPPILTNLR